MVLDMIPAQAMMAAPFVIVFLFLTGTLGSFILIKIYNFVLARATKNNQKGLSPSWSFLVGILLVVYLIMMISLDPGIN